MNGEENAAIPMKQIDANYVAVIVPNDDGMVNKSQQTTLDVNDDNCSDINFVSPVHSPTAVGDHTQVDPSSCVQVAVRVRPMLALEGDDECCVKVLHTSHDDSKGPTNSIRIGGSSGPQYTFDQVFDMETNQIQLYESRIAPLIGSCLDGYNATILAYGQTGSGKTHTIMGPNPTTAVSNDDVDAGVIPRAMTAMFESLSQKKDAQRDLGADLDYHVSVQFIELYGEEIRDLLVTTTAQRDHEKLTIRDLGTDEPEVVGATQIQVTSAVQALECLAHGMLRRVTGATAMNESSSRSHAILTVCIEQSVLFKGVTDHEAISHSEEEHLQVTRSKFNFVDLAGAERQKRTGASGKRLKEGIDINKGLSNLGNVISALGDPKKRGRSHVPYRDAKLTRLLKGSLGGNHKTLMIACVSPAAVNMGESLNCLRYANRAKNIQNKAVVNVDASTRIVQDLQAKVTVLALDLLKALDGNVDEIQFSREDLASLVGGGTLGSVAKPLTVLKPSTSAYLDVDVKANTIEEELSRTQRLLRQAQNYHDDAELELHTVRAHNCLLDAKVSFLTQDSEQAQNESIEQVFVKKAIVYESEISKLQVALRDAETTANQQMFSSMDYNVCDPSTDEFETSLDRLAHICLSQTRQTEVEPNSLKVGVLYSENLDVEDRTDQTKVDFLTKKYLPTDDNEDSGTCQLTIADKESAAGRVKQFSIDIEELSRSIETKERLILQIKRNSEREILMRKHFEQKLAELQTLLNEKECERDQLRHELELAGKKNSVSEEMTEHLHQKQKQIESLKRLHANYTRQSTSSSKSDVDDLSRLQKDVTLMKKRKADMQKELATEKKHHMQELGKFKKIVMQKDRAINKIQGISNFNAVEMEKAKAMSKSRFEELTQLKKIIRDYKHGVGLDPVMVGRRQVRLSGKDTKVESLSLDQSAIPAVVADTIRDYFDSKVATVVRKEALVDRLAKEWEEFFDLTTQRQLTTLTSENQESLDMQIQFKTDNIRKIALRLKRQERSNDDTIVHQQDRGEKFIFDKNFERLSSTFKRDTSRSMAARILFGMIVRERRRIASLAKVASSLDERVQATEKALFVSDAALRSCMVDHRQDVAELEGRHQDQIISLVDMVTESADCNGLELDGDLNSVVIFQKKLLVLANERVSLLEGQLSEQRSEKATMEDLETQINELNNLAASRAEECVILKQSENDLRTALRQIRDKVSNHANFVSDNDEINERSVVQIVDSVLYSTTSKSSDMVSFSNPYSLASKRHRLIVSPRFKKHIELMHSSDSDYSDDEDDDEPFETSTSTDLMADLAMIAKGKIPPSLRSPHILEATAKLNDDQHSFTPFEATEPSSEHVMYSKAENVTSTKQTYQSVFDRLGSPSQYTGTQKDKFHESRVNRERSAEHVPIAEKDPHSNLFIDPSPLPDFRPSTGIDREGYVKQNVFARLQKTTTHAAAIRQNETLHLEGRQNNEVKNNDDAVGPNQDGSVHRNNQDENKRSPNLVDHLVDGKSLGESKSALDRAAYTKQNVFDRLQKTTTLAAAVRQSETLHLDSRTNTDIKQMISPVSMDSETFPGKKFEGKRPSNTTSKPENGDHSSLNVFERLNKTTTRAYAKKSQKMTQNDS